MPTPGVAPREDARYADIRRRALEPRREPLPTRVEDVPDLPSVASMPWTPASRRSTSTSRRTRGAPSRVTPACCWPGRRHQPDRDPRPGGGRDGPRRRQSDGRRGLAARGIARFLDLGSGGGLPGPAARRGPPGRTGAPRGADRQEGPLPRDRHRGDRPRRPRRGGGHPRRGPRRRPASPRTLARGHGPGRRVRSPSWSNWRSRCSRRAGSSSRGSGATGGRGRGCPARDVGTRRRDAGGRTGRSRPASRATCWSS